MDGDPTGLHGRNSSLRRKLLCLTHYFVVSHSAPQVAIFAVVGVSGINAAQVGLILTYTSTYLDFIFEKTCRHQYSAIDPIV